VPREAGISFCQWFFVALLMRQGNMCRESVEVKKIERKILRANNVCA
jgi:hypothetical protein